MTEQNYNIFSFISPPHSVYLSDEDYNDELNSNEGFSSAWSDSDTSINFEVLEDFENKTSSQESNNEETSNQDSDNEIFEKTSDQEIEFKDEIIDHLKLTSCIIIDFIEGKMQ